MYSEACSSAPISIISGTGFASLTILPALTPRFIASSLLLSACSKVPVRHESDAFAIAHMLRSMDTTNESGLSPYLHVTCRHLPSREVYDPQDLPFTTPYAREYSSRVSPQPVFPLPTARVPLLKVCSPGPRFNATRTSARDKTQSDSTSTCYAEVHNLHASSLPINTY